MHGTNVKEQKPEIIFSAHRTVTSVLQPLCGDSSASITQAHKPDEIALGAVCLDTMCVRYLPPWQ